jgi:hypothetical protein
MLSGVQNPFLWESDEMESVESWLGVLICRASATADRPREARPNPGHSTRVRTNNALEFSETARRGARLSSRR